MKHQDTAVVALGVDPWKSLDRHPATQVVHSLHERGFLVDWLCIHRSTAVGASKLARLWPGVRVVGPALGPRMTAVVHDARKLLPLITATIRNRSIKRGRADLSHVVREQVQARSVVKSWRRSDQLVPDLAVLFGYNSLTTELLRSRVSAATRLFVETGDHRLRDPACSRLLSDTATILVPISPCDRPEAVRVAHPILFPVGATFRDEPTSRPDGTFVIGFAGRLDPSKGLTDLVAACEGIRPRLGPLRLLLLGDGPLRSHLEMLAEDRDWMEVGPGTSHAAALHAFYSSLDVFVVASRPEANEGMPLAMLEAMLSGAKVVATRVGGIADVLSEHVRIVPTRDPVALGEAILEASSSSLPNEDALHLIPTPFEYAAALLEVANSP
jgi:glycosyltransferase involved in cell wall biosynthesis